MARVYQLVLLLLPRQLLVLRLAAPFLRSGFLARPHAIIIDIDIVLVMVVVHEKRIIVVVGAFLILGLLKRLLVGMLLLLITANMLRDHALMSE